MAKFKQRYEFDEESSESDGDDFLQGEIEALSRVCMPTTTPSTSTINVGFFPEEDDDDDDEDFELLLSIKQKYGDVNSEPLCLEPLNTLPPYLSDEDDDDDFETFAAIQRRFSVRKDQDLRDDSGGGGGEFASEECMDGGGDDEKEESMVSGGLPKSALTLLEAIKKNRSCQKLIRSKMVHMETVMETNNNLRKRVRALRDFQVQCKKKVGRALSQKQCGYIQLISTRLQRGGVDVTAKNSNVSAMGYGPVENSQVACCKAALDRFPVMFQRKKWSEQERRSLRKGLVQQYQEMLFQEVANDANGSVVGVDAMVSRVADCDITPEIIQDYCFRGEVAWDRLASVSVPGRSGAECAAMWLNSENSLINKSKWTCEEDKKLLGLILSGDGKQGPGIHDWSLIATKLGTNRTAFQCLARFQRSLNPSILKRGWTEAEDTQLRSAVEDLGVNDWQAVASKLEGRTGTQCSDRWRKYLDPVITRVGKWNDDEDKRLKVGVKFMGKKWTSVAQFVPGRTDVQCRDRWENVLDPGLRWGEWTVEEDSELKAAVADLGYSSWSEIAARLGTRTDNQCWRRWKALFPHQVVEARVARMVEKAALPSNFVGREAERPALGAKDFALSLTAGPADEQEIDKVTQTQKKSRRETDAVQQKSRKKRETKQKSRKIRETDNFAADLAADCSSKEGTSRKRKRKNRSIEAKTIGESTKGMPDNSGTKKNKRRGSRSIAPQPEEKSSESTESDESRDLESCVNEKSDEATESDSFECHIPRIRSRRSREIKIRRHYS